MKILKICCKDKEVLQLQKLLNKCGYGLVEDSDFGPKTETAVKEFQKAHNLDSDGIVGAKTWAALGVIETTKQMGKVHIIINYGHSKATSGKRSPLYSTLSKDDQLYFKQFPEFGEDRYYEYLSNRVIGRQITTMLRERGWNVDEIEQVEANGLTEINNATRKLVKQYGAANCLFVSIHSNAAKTKDNGWANAKGWCIYTTKGQDMSDKLADCIYKYADECFVKQEGRNIRKNMVDGDIDQEENFSVILNAKQLGIAGVLTENFFFNDKDDLKYLVSKKGQNSIVRTHVMGIEDYINKYMI